MENRLVDATDNSRLCRRWSRQRRGRNICVGWGRGTREAAACQWQWLWIWKGSEIVNTSHFMCLLVVAHPYLMLGEVLYDPWVPWILSEIYKVVSETGRFVVLSLIILGYSTPFWVAGQVLGLADSC
jgi:hypothetical protein